MNNIHKDKQIITALATPYGKSAVAIVRISGDGCIELTERYISGSLDERILRVYKFKNGNFTERLMAVCFKAPNSYSGEDTVELYPHGNMAVCDNIISALLSGGARLAERGEFTRRAFLNGKIDLMQCEALADIIDAQTTEQLEYSNKRFDGGFKSLGKVENLLKTALADVEAMVHYGDELEGEDSDEKLEKGVYKAIDEAEKELELEIKGYAGGRIIKDGFKVAIIGEPNVGKSTLLNALTDSDRAIVTDIAGTTRDTIDIDFVYNGRKFTLTDTAGLREKTADEAERIGVERAKKAIETADAVIFVTLDGKTPGICVERFVTVKNKCDNAAEVGIEYKKCTDKNGAFEISAKNGINITALKQALYDLCPKDFGAICNHRQYDCAITCLDSLKAAKAEREKAGGLEIVAALLYEAYSAIEQMYGERADENVISAVFERFCVGK